MEAILTALYLDWDFFVEEGESQSGGGGRDIQRCLQGMFQVEGLVENILCG